MGGTIATDQSVTDWSECFMGWTNRSPIGLVLGVLAVGSLFGVVHILSASSCLN